MVVPVVRSGMRCLPVTIFKRSFKLLYSIPPSCSLSSEVKFRNCEFLPMVACLDNLKPCEGVCIACCTAVECFHVVGSCPMTNIEEAAPTNWSNDLALESFGMDRSDDRCRSLRLPEGSICWFCVDKADLAKSNHKGYISLRTPEEGNRQTGWSSCANRSSY